MKNVSLNITPKSLESMSPSHLAALLYANRGLKVLPIWPNSKKPMTATGHKAATSDNRIINTWWEKCPNANVAICTNGLLVLDIDIKGDADGYEALRDFELKCGKLPVTLNQETPSGGKHLIFRSSMFVPSLINSPRKGIDVRANDGYILAEGSTIDGKGYKMDTTPIAEAPKWLMETIVNKAGKHSSFDNICDYPEHSNSLNTFITLGNSNEIVTINAMGKSLKVKYDPKTNSLVTV
jgi:hypothetical protein